MPLMFVIISLLSDTDKNSTVMEPNVDETPAANLHWKVMKSSVSSLVVGAITTPTIVDSDVPDNGAAVFAWLNKTSFHLLMTYM